MHMFCDLPTTNITDAIENDKHELLCTHLFECQQDWPCYSKQLPEMCKTCWGEYGQSPSDVRQALAMWNS